MTRMTSSVGITFRVGDTLLRFAILGNTLPFAIPECWECYVEYCQSHITMLQI
jgi:hypothetical protein